MLCITRLRIIRRNIMKLAESSEHYLENILILQARKGEVRSIDIAQSMGYSKPSVSRAVHLLKDNGYLSMDVNSIIRLTDKGIKEAKRIYERHIFLREMLLHLGVNDETAAADACRMEHVISPETFDKLIEAFPALHKHVQGSAFDDDFILAFHRENHSNHH